MKRFVVTLAAFLLFGALASGWSADAQPLPAVSARRHHVTHRRAHKAGKHHQPKHHRTV